MRAGYPWEESDPALWEGLILGNYLPLIVHFPLVRDPGTGFGCSNLSSYILALIVARACETDLTSHAQEHLFAPLGAEVGFWHDAAWWRNHWSRTDLVDVEVADTMPNGHNVWRQWCQARFDAGYGGPNTASDIKVLSQDRGRYMGIVRIIGRRKPQPSALGDA